MKYSLKKIQAIVKKKLNNNNREKKTWSGTHCKKKIHYISTPFQKFIIGGSSGEGSKGNLLKLCENFRK